MAGITTRGPMVSDPETIRAEWLSRLDGLISQVRCWAEKTGWSTSTIEKSMRDSSLGSYKALALIMQRGTVKVILDPIGRFAPGTEGVVDLYLLPGYDDIASLYFVEDRWRLNYAFRPTRIVAAIKSAESRELEETFLIRVLEEIAAHAA